MAHIVGCVEAHELSTCKQGANQHAHHILRKSAAPTPGGQDPKPENTPMATEPTAAEKAAADQTAAIAKAARAVANKIAGMSDITKAHYLALDDAAQDVFLAKSAEDMAKEAEAAKAAKDKAAAEEEARKSGTTVEVLTLQKTVTEQAEVIKSLQAKDVERDMEKRASTEFANFPGGTVEAVKKLKSIAALPVDDRQGFEDMMKAQCIAAQESTKTFGGRTEQQVSKAAEAKTVLDEAAKAYAIEKKVSHAVAVEKVSEMPEFAEHVAAAYAN